MEKVKTPKHRPFHRRHNESSANHLRVDAERNTDGVHQEKPGCEADQPGESFPVILPDR